jgi:two-component system response regulator DesR
MLRTGDRGGGSGLTGLAERVQALGDQCESGSIPGGGFWRTVRERAVLAAAAPGASMAEIADALRLSEGTVRNYLSEASQKLGAQNRLEAARIA